ncbi:TVP38/TMEM64 family protein [Leptolyngbyaceae cyanobacterium CCMR0082]|uniref:TVP38/TMEM64 family membrane protein n=2 Tax=Adonisia turfae TaxID=2950184 RepID=A0A6M0S6U3_9CYAN|nr:TVP38/TMEM64 family protein [Adonisia turfae]MDV3353810.1 TVP38/TMEM64 family protein [Leptothoe sp. LEGE 181152]NEZ61120.1 TVP38/TMEM64 family protein [Adonisia turfae CCMR0081]NEZ63542.1 TVP38/TMEM64 family protein [Adonisia turfae CCMR0082]
MTGSKNMLGPLPSNQSKLAKVLTKFMSFAFIGMVLLAAAPAMAQDASGGIQGTLQNALNWVEGLGPVAPIVFILMYIVITVSFLPASVVTLGAGAVFGIVKGTILVFIGAMLGATAAFLIGRYLARDWVSNKVSGNRIFKAIYDAIEKEGRKIIFLVRLSPAFPFNLLNYALGLTNVSLTDYVLGTVGILPGTILYVYLGGVVGSAATGQERSPAEWAFLLVGLVATFAVVFIVTKVARKSLQESLPETNQPIEAES